MAFWLALGRYGGAESGEGGLEQLLEEAQSKTSGTGKRRIADDTRVSGCRVSRGEGGACLEHQQSHVRKNLVVVIFIPSGLLGRFFLQ